jgi:AcrR family transcriptional regulator
MSTAAEPSAAVMSTRERILFEASLQFAAAGYRATTTRDIAQAVGIQQPSLFHHFPTKSAIVVALLDWDLEHALPYARRLVTASDTAAVRLYHYICRDVSHLTSAPYNLTGIYAEDVMGDHEFAPWARRRDAIHAAVEQIVEQGIAAREFIAIRPAVVRETVTGILMRALTLHSGGRGSAEGLGDDIAALLVRGLLADPSTIHDVRERAHRYVLDEDVPE